MVFQIGNKFGKQNKGRKPSDLARMRMSLAAKGKIVSEKTKKKMSLSKIGNKHPLWKGNKVSYGALHSWVKRHFKKPKLCHDCKKEKPLDLTNKSGKYLRNLADWEWLCRKCHMIKDGRYLKLLKYNKKRRKILS